MMEIAASTAPIKMSPSPGRWSSYQVMASSSSTVASAESLTAKLTWRAWLEVGLAPPATVHRDRLRTSPEPTGPRAPPPTLLVRHRGRHTSACRGSRVARRRPRRVRVREDRGPSGEPRPIESTWQREYRPIVDLLIKQPHRRSRDDTADPIEHTGRTDSACRTTDGRADHPVLSGPGAMYPAIAWGSRRVLRARRVRRRRTRCSWQRSARVLRPS